MVAAVLIPEEDLVASVTRLNVLLISLLTILVLSGIAASLFISQRFLKPISTGLAIIKSDDLSGAPLTKVPEIDNLISYLATRNQELYEGAREKNLSFSILDEFVKNTDKLSPSERSVYELYIAGYTAKEIAESLCLSINPLNATPNTSMPNSILPPGRNCFYMSACWKKSAKTCHLFRQHQCTGAVMPAYRYRPAA
jgi:hypothetical protein